MDDRSAIFLEVMVAIALAGVAAFLIFLLVRKADSFQSRKQEEITSGWSAVNSPWYVFVLALLVLILVSGLLLWQFVAGNLWVWGESVIVWKADNRAIVFLSIMIVLGLLGSLVFIGFTVTQASSRVTKGPLTDEDVQLENSRVMQRPGSIKTPSGLRLIGLLMVFLCFLLICWLFLLPSEQHSLMTRLIYPASFAVAMVLLFDKVSRKWGDKTNSENVREWLFCDALVVLLLLAYLNVNSINEPEKYVSVFWDLLYILLFFVVFWILDRKDTRFRFLVAYGYFILVPLLLLIWQAVQGFSPLENVSWWATIWPFFILSVVFFVLEIVTLLALPEGKTNPVPALKDTIFILLYAVFLITAIPYCN